MAKREKRDVETKAVEMDMTPMIDIVFQMVMFFVIVTDFTQDEIALLTLPWSTVGIDDEGDDESRLIINITAPKLEKDDGSTKSKGYSRILVRNQEHDFESLSNFLLANGKNNPNYREPPPNQHLSSRSLLIRCDGYQAFDYVKAVLQVCAQPEVAIYKIEIATAEQAPKD